MKIIFDSTNGLNILFNIKISGVLLLIYSLSCPGITTSPEIFTEVKMSLFRKVCNVTQKLPKSPSNPPAPAEFSSTKKP